MAFRRIRILLLFGLVCYPPFLSERLLTPRGTGPRIPVVFPEYGESSLELNLKFLFYSACLLFMIIISTFTLVDVIWRGVFWTCHIGVGFATSEKIQENNQVAVLLFVVSDIIVN